jgi:DNA topoisomerase-2
MLQSDALKELEKETEDREKRKVLAAAQLSTSKNLLNVVEQRRRVQIPKLTDAPLAGTSDGRTTLIICEGDSAMGAVKSGLLKEQRDYYGVFPLRGKIPNALKKESKSFLANKEIQYLVDALGLKFDAPGSLTNLRYRNGIILATDQDSDGHHICSLVYSFFWMYFRPLLQAKPDFIKRMNTPLIKVSNAGERLEFMTKADFLEWSSSPSAPKSFSAKYFKGLGTNDNKDMNGYFRNIDKYIVPLEYTGKDSDLMVETLFGENVAERRKFLIQRNQHDVNPSLRPRSIEHYMYTETGAYFLEDIVRSLPCVVDGLKPALRKVVHAVIEKKAIQNTKAYKDNGMKVSEFSAAIAQSTMYHHGEVSMQKSVIGLAQCILGVNNVPLLHGTRESKPSESHAAPRYIFVNHLEFVENMFPIQELELLPRVEEDGDFAECVYFTPTVPYILVNGSEGIGTGWSSEILPRNFMQVLDLQKKYIRNRGVWDEAADSGALQTPFYEFFKGDIRSNGETLGKATITWKPKFAEIKIEELPVGVWTSDFMDSLRTKFDMKKEKDVNVKEKRFLVDLHDRSSAYQIDITLLCDVGQLKECHGLTEEMVDLPDAFLKLLGLVSKFSLNNCNALFPDKREHWIYNFCHARDIFNAHREFKVPILQKRYDLHKNNLEHELMYKKEQVRFLELVFEGTISFSFLRRSRSEVESDLESVYKFAKQGDVVKNYNYLLRLQFMSCTREHITELQNEIKKLETHLAEWNRMTIWDVWMRDVERLESSYHSFLEFETRERRELEEATLTSAMATTSTTRKRARKC